ncbi:heterokaryon incompatibility protein-domain-containing protein, partial [Diaporthe sp. PMI_573]
CGKTHIKCRHRRHQADVGWQPTRLVEVIPEPRPNDHADNIRCRLIELRSLNTRQDLEYITLSHRWPQNLQGFQKLTVDNLPLWKDSLPLETLSQTFRDAFLVAYRLGISYVWIDSLCIIQDGDDYTDWRKEAPLMHKVYSNAEFNICAAKNNQVEHYRGLFSSREPLSLQPLQVKFPKVVDDKEYDDSGHYLIRKQLFELEEAWSAGMDDSPLASRGWVLQEQLLSRANVHFGDQEVFFECLEMRASEYMGSDQDYEWSPLSSDAFFKEHLPIRDVIKGGLYKPWHNLLKQYTTLQLTKSDDRLVALSGVAQYFKKLFSPDDYYIAGLWRSRLPTEMFWQLTRESPREDWEKRKKTHRYLTFSWLSVKGSV